MENYNNYLKETVESLTILTSSKLYTDVLEDPFSKDTRHICIYCGKEVLTSSISLENNNLGYSRSCKCIESVSIRAVIVDLKMSIKKMEEDIKRIHTEAYKRSHKKYLDLYLKSIEERNRKEKEMDNIILNSDPNDIWNNKNIEEE